MQLRLNARSDSRAAVKFLQLITGQRPLSKRGSHHKIACKTHFCTRQR